MKPVKFLNPFISWILRFAFVALVYTNYFNTALRFSFEGLWYFIALGFVVLAVLLLLGGVMRTSKLTVLVGLLITVLCVVQLVLSPFSIKYLTTVFPFAALGLYFMTKGN